ncbi:SiaC family regulatory phosphoprotein [Ekhidna sp.]
MDYFRKATNTSPTVIMDSRNKSALVKGKLLCGDISVYNEVTSEIKNRLQKFEYADFNIQLQVFNTKAAKSILEILRSIKNTKRKSPRVYWLSDNPEMMEMGRDYGDLLDMEIEVLAN